MHSSDALSLITLYQDFIMLIIFFYTWDC